MKVAQISNEQNVHSDDEQQILKVNAVTADYFENCKK